MIHEKGSLDQCESVSHVIQFKVLLIEKITQDNASDCGMKLAWTMTMAMSRPLTLTLAGAMTLAGLRRMALIFDSEHGL